MAGARIIPVLRYDDAPAAIDWLCEAFGFERVMVAERGMSTGRGQEVVSQRPAGPALVRSAVGRCAWVLRAR